MELATGSGSRSSGEKASEMNEGSIVSLKLKNFLVYKDAKAIFGPRLNMVVGPNGSGKSTLVCAIALGLGGSPKVLGRADNISSFVMHGVKEDASVTVELFIKNGENLSITRTFSRKSNKSNWHMNGRSISEKMVKEKILALGIQVDNLCTMLPQDKVGDFSGFTPDKLLLETEKALSHERLYQSHIKLMELQENKGKSQNEEETTRAKLQGNESELAGLEKDKQRYEEREEKQNQLALYEKRKVWLDAEGLREKGIEAKQLQKAAEEELRIAQAADEPLKEEFRKWEREEAKLRGVEKNRGAQKSKSVDDAEAAKSKIEGFSAEAIDTSVNIENLEKTRKGKEVKLAESKRRLAQQRENLERAHEKVAQQEDAAEITSLINAKHSEIQAFRADLHGQNKLISDRRLDIRGEDAKIKSLTNAAAVREKNFVSRFRQDGTVALKVRDWAASNANLLKGPVVGPIGLEVTVEDSEAARAVEAHIPNHVWCSVVVNCKEDHDTIIHQFRNVRSSIGILVNQGGTLRPVTPPFSKPEMDELKKIGGVRGVLDDFISCKDTVKQVLRRNQKIHSVFLGSYATGQKINQDPDFLARLGKKGPNGVPMGSTIYAGGSHGAPAGAGGRNGAGVESLQIYHTKISLYGNKKPSVRVSDTRPAQVVGPGLDSVAIAEAQRKKAAFEEKLRAAQEKHRTIGEKSSGLEGQVNELKAELSNISNNVSIARTLEGKVKTLEKRIADQEAALAAGGDDEKARLLQRFENVLGKLAASVAAAQVRAGDVLDKSVEHMAAQCARRVAIDKLEDATDALRAAQDSRVELENKVHELKHTTAQILKEFKAAMKRAATAAPKMVNNVPTEFGQKYDELPNNLNELDALIDDIREDLNNSVHNPQVIHKYEKLKAETERVRKELKDLEEGNANFMKRMDEVRLPWKGFLETTIERLNNLFAEYMKDMDGCKGVVELSEDDSFKKWGIEIKVRFRSEKDQGKLTVLDKRVHSGGERSVSTILYLMALQDLQTSPFRVVDEINQGMDPKNERQVFSRIVKNSCGPHRKQYFLITPKLLQGLVAMNNQDMTVTFIMNGPNCITGTDDHTMRKFIAAKKRQLALEAGDAQGGGQRRRVV